MTVVILEDATETSSLVHNSMNRAQPELAITLSTQSFPILTLWFFLPVFIQSTLNSIGCCRSDFHSPSIMSWKTT